MDNLWSNNSAYLVGRTAIGGGSITSGQAYGFGNGAAYPNQGSLAVDTLETDGGVGGSGTLELNYYGGNAVKIGPNGTKPLYTSAMYDGDNPGYYVDPASSSNMNLVYANDYYIRATGKWASETSTVRMGNAGITLYNGATAVIVVPLTVGTEIDAYAKYENGNPYTRIEYKANLVGWDTGWVSGIDAQYVSGLVTYKAKITAAGVELTSARSGDPLAYKSYFGAWR